MITGLVAILFLASFVEGFVEYCFGKVEAMKPYLMYVALAFGVVLCVAYKVDIPSMLGLVASFGWVNWVVSGLIVGRGSNYVNDIFTTIKSVQKQ